MIPELRKLSLDPSYKTPECAPLLVTLGQGIKHVQSSLSLLRSQGLTLPPVHSESEGTLTNDALADRPPTQEVQQQDVQKQQQQREQQQLKQQQEPLVLHTQLQRQEQDVLQPGGGRERRLSSAHSEQSGAASPRSQLQAEPKPLKGYLKKRGDKGPVKTYKVRRKRAKAKKTTTGED